ncbi:16S rRNA (uracil(1498)-N(3))-methyltransferase [Nesterenkonia sp.]|uniref:16S rRNA (uracil(1498)-N(3))-methyltransferase n=1 Tax=Nesterenkonia sp. TaxID=704201 RepID=UPI0026106A61|nr:16S rRNA (uracil(1498)-N(3))-methyltransferase [Nesterenkonia sp.]
MTAPLFHLAAGSLDDADVGSVVVLDGPEGHHAATVMRMGPGEQVQLSDTQRLRAEGTVTAADQGQLSVELTALHREPDLRPHLVLVQALAKDKRDLQAIESAAELGVDAIIPWEAERSVARWKAGREAKKHAEWVSTVTAAAKQTRRTAIPQVEQLHTTADYLRRIQQDQPRPAVVVLHERERSSLRAALEAHGLDPTGQRESGVDQLHLVVGPEGGITDREIEQLTAAGARTARLGPTVLRSSTAGPAALAAAQLLLGRWEW